LQQPPSVAKTFYERLYTVEGFNFLSSSNVDCNFHQRHLHNSSFRYELAWGIIFSAAGTCCAVQIQIDFVF
jgi:hypothetical protein